MNKRTAASLAMLLGAMIWGAAFVFQKQAMDHIGPFTLGATRFFIGSLVVSPLLFMKKLQPAPATDQPFSKYLISGIVCGLALFAGVTFQQIGLMETTAGKGGFVTALYMIMVPIFVWIFFKRKITPLQWALVAVAFVGTFLLCVTFGGGESLSINRGDMFVFIGAIAWAVQILCLERFGSNLDSIKLSVVQFMTCSVLSAIPMFVIERPSAAAIGSALIPILYCGVLSVGVAFTAQVICLKHTDSIIATLIMSMESVFSVIFGFLLLGETLTARQIIGCVLVFGAVVLSELIPQIRQRRLSS